MQRKLDTLNKAGLSKDNFQDSDAKNAPTTNNLNTSGQSLDESHDNGKITDFFSTSKSSFTEEEMDAIFQDDSFAMEDLALMEEQGMLEDSNEPSTKKQRTD